MRGNSPIVLALTLTLAMALARPALAHPADCSAIPNGSVNTCANCHVSSSGGGTRTPFGEDVATTRSGGAVQWPALYDLDSDDDGQTNGQELGDPCGSWSAGATPGRTTGISNPGIASSVSSTPAVPTCTDAGSPDRATASDSAQPRPDSAVPPRDASSSDAGSRDAGLRDTSASDQATVDRAAVSDASASERAVCTPVCIDSNRLYSCTAAGAHVETPCPSGQFCTDGVCSTGSASDDQNGSGGCSCRAAPASAVLGLVLLAPVWRRHRRSLTPCLRPDARARRRPR